MAEVVRKMATVNRNLSGMAERTSEVESVAAVWRASFQKHGAVDPRRGKGGRIEELY